MKNQEVKNKFLELRATGLSYDKISRELNISKKTLIAWSKELAMEICNLKAIEIEALQEKYFMTKKMRIELYGEKLKAIKTELDTRSLSTISSDKLHELLIKYSTHLKQEGTNIVFKDEPLILDITESSWEA